MSRTRYRFIYLFTYLAIGALCPLIGKYLESEGYQGMAIGIVTSAGTVSAIAASVFWGRVYARCMRGRYVVAFLSFAAGLMCMILLTADVLQTIILVYVVMYFFQAPILALVDAMCSQETEVFGMSRMWGAFGYALGVFAAGRGAAYMSFDIIFYIYATSYFICGLLILTGRGGGNEKKPDCRGRRGYKELLRNQRYVRLIAAFFFFGGTNVANNTYYGFMYTDCGGTIAGMGLCMFIMILSEAPFMALAKSFSDRFTMEKMILIAMIASALRFAIYALGLPPQVICTAGVLQGVANGIALVEIIRYIGKITNERDLGLATSLYYAAASNMSTIVCQYFGGIVLEHFGGCSVYAFFAVYNVAGILLYVWFGLHRKYDGQTEGKNPERIRNNP